MNSIRFWPMHLLLNMQSLYSRRAGSTLQRSLHVETLPLVDYDQLFHLLPLKLGCEEDYIQDIEF